MTNHKQIWEADKRHWMHPWTHFESFQQEGSLILSRARGSRLWDSNANSYFDAVGGLWCTNIGLGREEMAETIAEQVRQLAYANPFVDMANEPAVALAEKLAQLAPGDINRVFFTCGGSTAVDTAFRLIHFYQNCRGMPHKKHIIARRGGYHGSTYAAMSITGKSGDRIAEFDYISDTIHHLSCPNYYRAPEGMDEQQFCDSLVEEFQQKIDQLGADKIAAFFAEPILGSGGVIVPPADYNRRMWELCKANDILYVADEVVTAFGRVGHWFACEEMFGVQPDIITCAKGLTSGYLPLGATLFSDRIYEVISSGDSDRYFASGFTYSGHPVACAAALKNIEIIERENLLQRVVKVGAYFEERLQTLRELPLVGDVRGKRFMMCVENVRDKNTREVFPDSLNIGKWISDRAEEAGLIVRPIVHLNVMSPPLTMDYQEVDFVVERLGQAILQTHSDLVAEGHLPAPSGAVAGAISGSASASIAGSLPA
ncbi:putrescine--pyruvate aminotransferase [Microbulbifer aestuariivivens]|uniref:Putrescine--pyruvate aminotransferase n=1 Tax=Microbulbifer aestuariivivens TaxID=1908308 RepID=A0ABP9WPR5_9GAMM